ncbi:hypothetical protein [Phenylobacterium sp.]|uniref:hypothetical protein n=1 Tax=Phenylobacterium sp. TaxID=1871053 RepID=UPI002C1C197B|nr:hypothetical protein [Phenylobacterium sp.]HVI32489.1 hypothetical protein [Phenylobacterium sp.]
MSRHLPSGASAEEEIVHNPPYFVTGGISISIHLICQGEEFSPRGTDIAQAAFSKLKHGDGIERRYVNPVNVPVRIFFQAPLTLSGEDSE